MRPGKFTLLVLITGCGALQTLVPIPDSPLGLKPIVGGPADQQPYFGTVKNARDGSTGDFLLATCGCGSWRVLVQKQDGSAQWQLPVRFYSPDGADQPVGDVTAFGREQDNALLATLHQVDGQMEGRTEHGAATFRLSAVRRETHTDDAQACVLCHVGDNPIFPQSSQHPAFTLDPPNCLSCHTVVITP